MIFFLISECCWQGPGLRPHCNLSMAVHGYSVRKTNCLFRSHIIVAEAPVDGLTVKYPCLFTNIPYIIICTRLYFQSIMYGTIIRASTILTFWSFFVSRYLAGTCRKIISSILPSTLLWYALTFGRIGCLGHNIKCPRCVSAHPFVLICYGNTLYLCPNFLEEGPL